MPAMQEQLQAIAMDGMYAGNAGAIAGLWRDRRLLADVGVAKH